jgi:hypothetical protein
MVLLAVCVVAGAISYLLVRVVYDSLPQLPRFGPASLLLVAFAEAVLAVQTRNRLAHRPGARPVEPIVAARYAALAKASSLVGALATGAYLGLLGYVLPLRDAPDPRSDAWTCAFGAGAGLVLVAAAYALEHVCRVKEPPEPPEPPPAPG